MATILWANNAQTTLAAGISSSATSVTLATGTGSSFPAPTGGNYFLATLVDAATGLVREIVKVTAMSGDTATIVRAQESTTAVAWLTGDTFANFITAGGLGAMAQIANISALTNPYSSLASTGYTSFANGMMIQWGNTTITAGAGTNQAITFPRTFPTGCFQVYATSNSVNSYAGANTPSTTGCNIFASNNSVAVSWFAIGY